MLTEDVQTNSTRLTQATVFHILCRDQHEISKEIQNNSAYFIAIIQYNPMQFHSAPFFIAIGCKLMQFCGCQQHLHHKTSGHRRDHVRNVHADRMHVRKSWRSGTSTILPGWRGHTGGSRSIPTVHPCPQSGGRLWVARLNETTDETTEDRDSTTDEPETLHKTYESRKFAKSFNKKSCNSTTLFNAFQINSIQIQFKFIFKFIFNAHHVTLSSVQRNSSQIQ